MASVYRRRALPSFSFAIYGCIMTRGCLEEKAATQECNGELIAYNNYSYNATATQWSIKQQKRAPAPTRTARNVVFSSHKAKTHSAVPEWEIIYMLTSNHPEKTSQQRERESRHIEYNVKLQQSCTRLCVYKYNSSKQTSLPEAFALTDHDLMCISVVK